MPFCQLTLVRHGKSVWNQENRFTGWEDVNLSEEGHKEAVAAAATLKSAGIRFDVAYSSWLRRAIQTMWIILRETDLMWIPQRTDWRFNERHYGDLQGMNKAEAAERFGEEQVNLWRRGYDHTPPLATCPTATADGRYEGVKTPLGESLSDVKKRVDVVFDDFVVPQLEARQSVLLVAHGNTLRALIKRLDNVPDDEVNQVEVPTAAPIYYELDTDLKPMAKWPLRG